MATKVAKWTCLCGKVFSGKWKLYHHIENSHLRETLRNLEQDITKNQCFYCDNKSIKESTMHKHTKKHHMKRAINDFIKFQCSRV